jgi:hypothetical protein
MMLKAANSELDARERSEHQDVLVAIDLIVRKHIKTNLN